MNVNQAITLFLSDAQYRNLSAKTLRFYQQQLGIFAGHFGTEVVDQVTVPQIKAMLVTERKQRDWTTGTVNHQITAIRRLYSFLVEEELLPHDPMHKLKKITAEQRLPEPFSEDELRRLLAAAAQGQHPVREQAVLLVLLDCGLRLGELHKLEVDDIDLPLMQIHVRLGKGRKGRIVPFSPPTRKALAKWIAVRPGPEDGPLWTTNAGTPMEEWSIVSMVRRIAKRAKVEGCHLHRFRHSFAFTYLQQGGSIAHLQRLLGHSTPTMTQRYGHLADLDATEDHRRASPVVGLLGQNGRKK